MILSLCGWSWSKPMWGFVLIVMRRSRDRWIVRPGDERILKLRLCFRGCGSPCSCMAAGNGANRGLWWVFVGLEFGGGEEEEEKATPALASDFGDPAVDRFLFGREVVDRAGWVLLRLRRPVPVALQYGIDVIFSAEEV